MTTSNRSKAASVASTPDTDESSVSVPAGAEAPMAGDTSAPAALDAPADEPAPVPAVPAVPAPVSAPAASAPAEDDELARRRASFRAGRVPILLAHPLDGIENFRRLRLETDPDRPEGGYRVHDEIWLVRDDARNLIKAGYAQVDPENKEAVRAALRGPQAVIDAPTA